ncbi:MAG: acyl-CoA dehydrogenase, partial [Thermodesulfobacteriota bacterium]|nr:acyl-CoA dehydrogenase [Thermodesulfobacteriota bacterium]
NDVCTTAKSENNHYIISGTKTFVEIANAADKYILSARTSGGQYDEKGITLFLIDSGSDGITLIPCVSMDGRKRFHVRFDNVKVPSSNRLGKEGEGYHIIKEVALRSTVGLTGEMLGGMEEAFDITIKYMKQRVQFDRPIGSFQALQHRCVDMWMQIQLSRSAVLESALQFDSNTDSKEIAISIAKARSSNAFKLVGSEGIQMHGAIGMTDECDIGLFLKRAKVSEVTFGDADFHYERYERLTENSHKV